MPPRGLRVAIGHSFAEMGAEFVEALLDARQELVFACVGAFAVGLIEAQPRFRSVQVALVRRVVDALDLVVELEANVHRDSSSAVFCWTWPTFTWPARLMWTAGTSNRRTMASSRIAARYRFWLCVI